MTRWTTGIVFTIVGLLCGAGFAQDRWEAPSAHPSGSPMFHPTGHQTGPPGGPAAPPTWHYQRQNPDPTIEQLLPNQGVMYDTDSRFALDLRETFARSWIRADYLLWSLKGPGRTPLGAPLSADAAIDADGTFPAIDSLGARIETRAFRPDLESAGLSRLNGIRGAFGIPTRVGSLEAEAWNIQQATRTITHDPFVDTSLQPPVTIIPAVPLLRAGVPSDQRMILFSEDYRARLQTNLFGAEGNWVLNPISPNAPVEISPLVGLRYVRLTESLSIAGTDIPDPLNDPDTVLDHRIDSRSRNNVYGPQLGVRAVTEMGRFTFGAETKVIFGINSTRNQVATEQIFTPDEDPRLEVEGENRFAPMFDLSLYSKIQVTERFSLRVAYELLYAGGFTRAFDNIRYDSAPSITDPPRIGLDVKGRNFYAHGLTIGGELLFR
jgi:hypothetical protein